LGNGVQRTQNVNMPRRPTAGFTARRVWNVMLCVKHPRKQATFEFELRLAGPGVQTRVMRPLCYSLADYVPYGEDVQSWRT
jgi:hypothetical protein